MSSVLFYVERRDVRLDDFYIIKSRALGGTHSKWLAISTDSRVKEYCLMKILSGNKTLKFVDLDKNDIEKLTKILNESKEQWLKKYFKQGEPVVRNRASVVHAELSVKFLSKEQCELFVKDIVSKESYPCFSVETVVGDSMTHDEFIVTLEDICWANNLVRISKILEKYDYNGGE